MTAFYYKSINMKKITFLAAMLCCIIGFTPQHTRAEEITLCSFYDGNGGTFGGWGGSFEYDIVEDGKPCLKFSNDEEKDSWYIQACISADFEEGTTYTISFDVKGTPAVLTWDFQKSDGYVGRGSTDPFDITEDWSRVSIKGTPDGEGADRMLLNLGKYVGIMYISNLVITYEWDGPTTGVSLITNGDCSTGDNSCFFSKTADADPSPCTIDESEKAYKVEANANPAQEWSSQFFIKANRKIASGEKMVFSMKVKCTDSRKIDIQSHRDNPGNYAGNGFVGNEFTTKVGEWIEYKWTGLNEYADCDVIGFNLSKNPEAATIWFKDIVWEIAGKPIVNEGIIASYLGEQGYNGDFLQLNGHNTFYSTTYGINGREYLKVTHTGGVSSDPFNCCQRFPIKSLTQGKTYRLTFDVAGTPAQDIPVRVSNWDIYSPNNIKNYFSSGFDVTEHWQRVTLEITPEYEIEGWNYIYIGLENYVGEMWITNLYLYDALDSPELPAIPDIDPADTPLSIHINLPLAVGASTQLQTSAIPETASSQPVTWSSDDETIAVVKDGLVTGKSKGNIRIFARSDVTSTYDWLWVSVYEPESVVVPVSMITIDPMVIDDAKVGDQIRLTANVMPENADDKSVTWSSSKEEVATVDESGLVTIVAPGTAVITATANDGNGAKGVCLISGMSGIEHIVYSSPDEPKDIYTIDGKLIMRRATLDDINRLSQGVYLIGNQKIAIR